MGPPTLAMDSKRRPEVSSDAFKSKVETKPHFASVNTLEQNPVDFLRVLFEGSIAGGAAGVIVETALYPIDTIKTRLQAVRGGGKILLKGLYSGLGGNLAGVLPASAIFVGVYEPAKQKLLKIFPENLSALAHLTAGAIGGAASSLVRVPTEVVKQRMQTGQFASASNAVRLIVSKEGFRGLYAGYGSFLLRDLPFDAIQFCLYEQLRIGYKLAAKRELNDPENAIIGAFAGSLTGAITTPLDVIKTRLMVQVVHPLSLKTDTFFHMNVSIDNILFEDFLCRDQETSTKVFKRARTSNLNEELGQVDTILSDKTGTLTCNSMDFVKCSIVGTVYGRGVTEVEQAIAKRKRHQQPQELADTSPDLEEHKDDATSSKMPIKGFNFRDERLMNGHWVKEPHSEIIQQFFRTLAICHTAIPDVNTETGEISYEAESPDESAFVIAARELGFEFYERTQTKILLHKLDPMTGRKVNRSYELLHVLEFSSLRKRMSVIVRNEEGQLVLHCKGADSVMFERLSKDGQMFVAETKNHIRKFAEAGLRTMVVAYREIGEEEYRTWKVEFFEAKTSVTADRETLVDAAAEKIERDLILLGATAVEDKLQKGVPDCINKLALAGIKIWVLTGDKLETAVNIGYACNLLREGMKQIVITLDKADLTDLQKEEDKEATVKASRESVAHQIQEGKNQVCSAKKCSIDSALVVDGNSLSHALTGDLENFFLDLATDCVSVICCRSSPKQKALVTKLVKRRTGRTTLAIGDGANDVGMLQEAEVGVGISGVEGMQAIMSSDFAIAEFRFLERLLLVHGHWCYRRISMMICYFFYKNLAYGFTLFWFEAYSSFSGQPAYNDWYMSFYNVFFTSLPVIALGVFDRDVSAELCLKYPILHQEGVQNMLFSWPRILGWMLYGIYSSIIIFFFSTSSIYHQAFRRDGRVAGFEVLGVLLYSCVVWTVNCQILVCSNYITWIQHFFIWGSIASWYVFLVIYGSLPPMASTTAYKVLVEVCAPSPLYWFTILIVVVCALLPYFSYKVFWVNFFPMYHNLIQSTELRRGENLDSQSELRTKPGV